MSNWINIVNAIVSNLLIVPDDDIFIDPKKHVGEIHYNDIDLHIKITSDKIIITNKGDIEVVKLSNFSYLTEYFNQIQNGSSMEH